MSLNEPECSLVPFHNFSPVLKSLRVVSSILRCSQIFDLICSLPLLGDLSIMSFGARNDVDDVTTFKPSASPVLNGTLALHLPQGMEFTTRRLLALPNGLHFRKLVCNWWLKEDLQWIAALLAGCPDTLEQVDIECCRSRTFLRFPFWDQYLTETFACFRNYMGGFNRLV